MLLAYISLPLSSLLPITEVRENDNPPRLVKRGNGYDLERVCFLDTFEVALDLLFKIRARSMTILES